MCSSSWWYLTVKWIKAISLVCHCEIRMQNSKSWNKSCKVAIFLPFFFSFAFLLENMTAGIRSNAFIFQQIPHTWLVIYFIEEKWNWLQQDLNWVSQRVGTNVVRRCFQRFIILRNHRLICVRRLMKNMYHILVTKKRLLDWN